MRYIVLSLTNKKSIAVFRHDYLHLFIVYLRLCLWRYFNDKCRERIQVMREHKSLNSQADFLHSRTELDARSQIYSLRLLSALAQTLRVHAQTQNLYLLFL